MKIIETGRMDTDEGLQRMRELAGGPGTTMKVASCDLLAENVWAFCDDGSFLVDPETFEVSDRELDMWDVD